jgi:photosystem II stability/assembly factor-like uncharacterized protein
VKRALVLGLVALALTGASATERRFGELRVTATGPVAFRWTPRPHFQGPGPNITDVALLSPRLGLVSTWHNRGEPRPRIQRTTDGGRTWHDVLRGHGAAKFAWLASGARTVYAGGFGPRGNAALAVSRDAGRSWAWFRPHLPRVRIDDWLQLRVVFVTRRFAYSFPDPAGYGMGAYLRTVDGGRTWQRLRLPKGTAGIQFVDPLHGYAAGGAYQARCDGVLWRTADGGSTWKRVMCGRVPLAAVQFLDARHGFVAGGWAAVNEASPSGIMYATSDGGTTWQRRYVNRRTGYHGGIDPFVELRFLGARGGWARTGQCKCCPSGPCAGEVLVTRDGGRTWVSRGSEVEISTVGVREAWVVPRCEDACNYILRTRDAGRTWRPLARADLLVGTPAVSGGLVSLAGEAARFVSRDGRRWRLADRDALAERPGYSIAPFCSFPRCGLASRHFGRTYRFTGRVADAQAVAIADDRHAYALPYLGFGSECKTESTRRLYATSDGGRSWRRRRVPFNIASLAADGSFVAAVGLRGGCSTVLGLSRDDGHTWRIRRLPRKGCVVSVAREDVWLDCGAKLLVSADRGDRWTLREEARRFYITRLAAAGKGEAWALVATPHRAQRLFRTSDGGRTWLEQWPRLPTP